jgi:N-acetyl-alpha-D-muramate 1-phosphate uridylyltransferase
MSEPITTALVLAAGFGKRMRPLTDTIPKPLVPLDGKPLLDHVLDRLNAAGVTNAVVNVHYLADKIEAHLKTRFHPHVTISDERDALLDTGGAVIRARDRLGAGPYMIHNSDSVWIESGESNLSRLVGHYDEDLMDGILLLAPTATSLGYDGRGDFHLNTDGTLSRQSGNEPAPYVFAGVSIIDSIMFSGEKEHAFSLNKIWDMSIYAGRLFGVVLEGLWMHVGTPESLAHAEAAIANHRDKRL